MLGSGLVWVVRCGGECIVEERPGVCVGAAKGRVERPTGACEVVFVGRVWVVCCGRVRPCGGRGGRLAEELEWWRSGCGGVVVFAGGRVVVGVGSGGGRERERAF